MSPQPVKKKKKKVTFSLDSKKKLGRKFRAFGNRSGTLRLVKTLKAFDIQHDTDVLRCIINVILAQSLQNAIPLHPDAPERHLGISEAPLTTTEWTEVFKSRTIWV